MRIISGKYRGKKLLSFENDNIKPTIDRVKEAVFSIISPHLKNFNFLDLFSGSGAIGIEAISRGSNETFFIEKDIKSINLIKKNLASLKNLDKNYQLINNDYISFLKSNNIKFDIIYLDPPFSEDYNKIINNLITYKPYHQNSIIVIESKRDKDINFQNLFNTKQYFYGDIKITILTTINE